METNYYSRIISITIFLLLISVSAFSANHINEVFANQSFQISETNDVIDIAINKNPWESFTFAIDNSELINNPVVNLDIKSNEELTLRVDLTDGIFMSSELGVIQMQVSSVGNFNSVSFDFTDLIHDIDLSEDVYLVFYVNPGQTFNGEISIQNFNLSTETKNQLSTSSSAEQEFKMYPSPATTYTNVEIPNEWFTTLSVINLNGQELASYDVNMYSGSTYRVELSDLPKGFYTVQLTNGETSLSEKLIIK